MTQATIMQSIQQFSFQFGTLGQSADQALTSATAIVDSMLSKSSDLATKFSANSDIVYQSIQQFAFQGIGGGKTVDKAVGDACATVESMLQKAADLAAKYK